MTFLTTVLLRVAGRSAGFPTRLREKLSTRFEGSYQELNLAPLTWADAAQAATAESPSGDAATLSQAGRNSDNMRFGEQHASLRG
jgi:hypothetical protein